MHHLDLLIPAGLLSGSELRPAPVPVPWPHLEVHVMQTPRPRTSLVASIPWTILGIALLLALPGCRSVGTGRALTEPGAAVPSASGPIAKYVGGGHRKDAGAGVVTIPVSAVVREGHPVFDSSSEAAPADLILFEKPTPAGPGPRPFSQQVGQGSTKPETEQVGRSSAARVEPGARIGVSKVLDDSFDSTVFADNVTTTGSVFIPPDPHAAVGNDHLVNVVNTTIRFHGRDGALEFEDSLMDFFTSLSPLTFTFDPKVLYDQFEDRFVVVTLERTDTGNGDAADTSRIMLAVSDDGDPNGTWYVTGWSSLVDFSGTAAWADYPCFALDDAAIYVSTSMFAFSAGGGVFQGSRQWVVDKGVLAGLYAGGGATVKVFDLYTTVGYPSLASTIQPAHIFGSSPFASGAGTYFTAFSGLSSGGNEAVQVIRLEDPLDASPTVGNQFVFLGNIDDLGGAGLNNAPQLGTSTLIETNDRRTLDAVWRDDSLWVTTTIDPVTGDADDGQATAYWIHLDTTSPSVLSLADQGKISGEDIATGTYTYFPSIAVNSDGDVGIGFSASSSTTYAGSYYTWRQAGDAAGTTRGSQVLRAGTDYYIRTFGGSQNRWGDYTATVVDPVSECFWTYNEHAMTRGTITSPPVEDGRWATAYGLYCPCSETTSLVAGQWKQISLPCDVGGFETVENVLADDLGAGGYLSDWAVIERDASGQQYVQLALTDPLEEGKGYWIKTLSSGQSVKVEGSRNQVIETPLVSDAAGRVNLVGHPFDFNVCWADVTVFDGASALGLDQVDPVVGIDRACETGDPLGNGCVMSREAYLWNGAAYQVIDGETPTMEGTLTPFDGVWVKAFASGISLRIPAVAGCGSKQPVRSSGSGLVRLVATSGDLDDPGNLLGFLDGAADGRDRHDLVEPPPFESPYLTVVFPHPEWGGLSETFTTDLREARAGAGGVWELEIRSDSARTVTLSWSAVDAGGADLIARARLVDLETGQVYADLSTGSVSLDVDAGANRLQWIVDAMPSAGEIFSDRFESGNTTSWSSEVHATGESRGRH